VQELSLYGKYTAQELKDFLGWLEPQRVDAFEQLVTVCMLLCDKIAKLESARATIPRAERK
jgi:hypothetical protein